MGIGRVTSAETRAKEHVFADCIIEEVTEAGLSSLQKCLLLERVWMMIVR